MTRVMIVSILLFLLPFVVFGAWRWLITGARGRRAIMTDAPIIVLMVLGIGCVAGGLFFLASYEKPGVEGRYHPPEFKDGKIQPGYFEKPAE